MMSANLWWFFGGWATAKVAAATVRRLRVSPEYVRGWRDAMRQEHPPQAVHIDGGTDG